ncbi:MAG: prolipoprotein diacylglyceryl transferase [Cytophagales bacterium]|nr:prolipoprotein diacylglyceryl transferase [Cytophagales bacterium]
MTGWIDRLKQKWGVTTTKVIIILVVFACTGFTVMFLKEPLLSLVAPVEERNWVFSLVYYLLIFPIYNLILLAYGFLFGQFRFFWAFEKRMFSRLVGNKKST